MTTTATAVRWELESQPHRHVLTSKAHLAAGDGWTLCGMRIGPATAAAADVDCRLCIALADRAEEVQPLHSGARR